MNNPIRGSTETGGAADRDASPPERAESPLLERIAQRTCAWSERWMPDAYVFAATAVVVVAAIALILGVAPVTTAKAFGDGFWGLIPFTMQMTFIIIGGYVVASSPPVERPPTRCRFTWGGRCRSITPRRRCRISSIRSG